MWMHDVQAHVWAHGDVLSYAQVPTLSCTVMHWLHVHTYSHFHMHLYAHWLHVQLCGCVGGHGCVAMQMYQWAMQSLKP